VLIASDADALGFGGIMGRLEVVRNRDYRQQNQREQSQRRQLHDDSRAQRRPTPATFNQPYCPEGERDCDPDEI
jgi:hypothetical protein